MLKIFIDGSCENIPSNIEKDVEKLFLTTKIHGTDKDKKVIEIVEQGRWLNELEFIDRFGYKLPIEDLSTGSKAALCVLNNPDKVISTKECGANARDIIVSICDNGSIVIDNRDLTFCDYSDGTIDVQVNNYEIFSIDKLNKYVFEEMFSGEVSKEAVKCLD